MDKEQTKELREILLDNQQFLQLADTFIDHASSEFDKHAIASQRSSSFSQYFKPAAQAIFRDSANVIEARVASPIEKIFLRSLMLCFIKNDGLGLVVHPTFKNTAVEIAEFRESLLRWRNFFEWFQKNHPNTPMEAFFEQEVQRGAMPAEERGTYIRWAFLYGLIPMDNAFHMSIQAPFPDIKVNGRSIRPDIYFWIPSNPKVNIVVECDGFQFHSNKEMFTSDRQRDRALQERRYEVLRFSGSEIFADPIQSSHSLATYLWNRKDEHDSSTGAGNA